MATAAALQSGGLIEPIYAHNTFALSLHSAYAQVNPGRNFLLSPISIFATLSMILPGARKQTLDQLVSGMRLSESGQKPLSAESLAQLESSLGRMLHSVSSDSLKSVNKIFIEADMKVKSHYLSTVYYKFNSWIYKANFSGDPETERVRINNRVATATKDKITELLKMGSIGTSTRLLLCNAVYFKAKWTQPFDPEATIDARFELSASAAVSVPTMRRTGQVRLLSIPDVLTGVRLGFNDTKDQRLSLIALLPAQRHQLDEILAKLTVQDWARLVGDPGELVEAELELPKMKLSNFAELSNDAYLPKLGIDRLFSDRADLSGISSSPGDLFVSSFAHQAAIEWDEFGAEGAAATAAGVSVTGAFDQPISIKFDQPFIFGVVREVVDEDGQSRHVPIFLGRVTDPRA